MQKEAFLESISEKASYFVSILTTKEKTVFETGHKCPNLRTQ